MESGVAVESEATVGKPCGYADRAEAAQVLRTGSGGVRRAQHTLVTGSEIQHPSRTGFGVAELSRTNSDESTRRVDARAICGWPSASKREVARWRAVERLNEYLTAPSSDEHDEPVSRVQLRRRRSCQRLVPLPKLSNSLTGAGVEGPQPHDALRRRRDEPTIARERERGL